MDFKVGDRVVLTEKALMLNYVANRRRYTNVYTGKIGTIITIATTGKIGIEFDTYIFTFSDGILSSHDNGCFGKGKLHYCWYFPPSAITLLTDEVVNEENNNLLLLL